MNNYDKPYLNRPAAVFLSFSVWKLYLPLRDQTTTMFMLCLHYYFSYEFGGSGLDMKTAQCFSSCLAVLKVCVIVLRYLLMIKLKTGLYFVKNSKF